MPALFEIVPNFSEGRDPSFVPAVIRAMEAQGADVLDASMDVDHHRSVVTAVGTARQVVDAGVAAAEVALERINLTAHRGVHPRIGAMDVLPFVPLVQATPEEASRLALEAGARIAELGIPVCLYGWASSPSGRGLADLRRGGFEARLDGRWEGPDPDLLPPGPHACRVHPTAGVSCVGARPVLLAWNVYVEGVEFEDLRAIAHEIRDRNGGFPGLRALAFKLESRNRMQVSMNLEDVERTAPYDVFHLIEKRVHERNGRVAGTEIIGMVPDALLLSAATDRLRLEDVGPDRLLSARAARSIGRRWSG